MTFRRLLAGSLVMLALLAVSATSQAGTVVFKDTAFNQNTSGGEFGAFSFSGSFITPDSKVTYNSSFTNDGSDFHTFCVELSESVAFNQTYYYELNTKSVNSNKDLEVETAKLFYAFYADAWTTTGNLGLVADYDYDSTVAARNLSSEILQKTFWTLQGQTAAYSADAGVISLIAWAEDVTWSELGQSGWTDSDNGVRIMNVWKYSNMTGAIQDQLVVVPLPASALMGLGLLGGLGIVSALRRRRRLE